MKAKNKIKYTNFLIWVDNNSFIFKEYRYLINDPEKVPITEAELVEKYIAHLKEKDSDIMPF